MELFSRITLRDLWLTEFEYILVTLNVCPTPSELTPVRTLESS
jgi:hypothetical protein